jgi:hypothetical protein
MAAEPHLIADVAQRGGGNARVERGDGHLNGQRWQPTPLSSDQREFRDERLRNALASAGSARRWDSSNTDGPREAFADPSMALVPDDCVCPKSSRPVRSRPAAEVNGPSTTVIG